MVATSVISKAGFILHCNISSHPQKTAENLQKEHEANMALVTRDHENKMKQARAEWLKERNHLQEQAELEKKEVGQIA